MNRGSCSQSWSRRAVLSGIGMTLCAGCAAPSGRGTAPLNGNSSNGSGDTPIGSWSPPTDAPTTDVDVNVLVEGLENPWDVSVAPNGDVFISERVGRITRFTAGEIEDVLAPESAIDAEAVSPGSDERPWWVQGGEGGVLGVALHPEYPDDSSVYVYYTAAVSDARVNRVSRFDISASDPATTETILIDDIPGFRVHNGGRIEFGPDGYLWATTGTAAFDNDEESERATDPGSLAGAVLRITAEGDPAPGNPDIGDEADPRVYTYGHRNPQGIVWLPDGSVLVNEHGGTGYDEINRLVAGAYYGWPNKPRTRKKYVDADDVHPPLVNSGKNTWAPSGSVFYTGDDVPSWSNRMLIGGLLSQQVLIATITPPGGQLPPVGEEGRRFDDEWLDDAYVVTTHPVLKNELGRVRHLEQGPTGELYAITSNRDGRAQAPFPRDRDDVFVQITGT